MPQKAIIVGVSGASSSGKTTLARLLRDIFPNTFVLHEDDFYKPEDQLPVRDGLVDWDSIESIAVPDMESALAHIRANGELPPTLLSYQDQNSVGPCPVSDATIQAMKDKVTSWLAPGQAGARVFAATADAPLRVCLLDGFLLYATSLERLMAKLDIKLFLRVSHARATERRAARDGYVTLEGFWKDPPGYVDKIVWPNYVAAHAWLFAGGDVEGTLDGDVLAKKGIIAQVDRGPDVDFAVTLEWAVEVLMRELERLADERA